MKDTFKLSIHPKEYDSKPTDAYKLQSDYVTTTTTLDGLKEIIYNGQTVVPAILKDGYRKNANFSGSQVIFLDFDDNQNPQTEITKYEEYGINVNLFYNSYSHKEDYNKFRLVIVLDTVIEEGTTYRNIVKSLIKVGGSDEACKDLARMFFAGTNAEVLNDNINKWDEVKGALTDLINKDKKQNHYSLTRKKIDNVKKCGNSTLALSNIVRVESPQKRKMQRFEFDEACKNSPLFNEFDKGEVHLKYGQLRALISNLMFVDGGLKYTKEKMTLRGDYKGEDWSLLNRIPNAGYEHPEGMSSFDISISDDYRNILALDEKKRDFIIQTRNIVKEHVDIISDRMKVHHRNALNSINRVSIINAPPGTGKTELMIKEENVIIALPTHKLKDEVAERMDKGNLPYVVTPNPPEFVTIELMSRYNNLQAMEESDFASNLVKRVADNKDVDGIEYTEEDNQIALEFKEALNDAYNASVTVLTTHSRMMLTPKNFKNKDVVYFDEDITSELLSTKSVKAGYVYDKLNRLVSSSKKGSDFNKDAIMVKLVVEGIIGGIVGTLATELPTRFIDRNGFFSRLATMEGYSQLARFLNSGESRLFLGERVGSISSFGYGELKGFNEVFSKIIVFSATADKFFYDNIFSRNKEGDYDFFHCGFAKNKKDITQDVTRSWSKSTMKSGKFPIVNSDIVLTHKKYAGSFEGKEEQDIYFGNTQGIDKYKGKDISVVGVMIEPTSSTIMKAILLGFTPPTNPIKSMQIVDLDVYSYPFFTFEDKNLRQIEQRSAMSPLNQTVGRARTTRTDAKVDVHASLPTPDADKFIGKSILESFNEELGDMSTVFTKKEDDFFGEVMDEIYNESDENYRQVDLFYDN